VVAAMFSKPLAEPVIAVLGSYVLFYLAFKTKVVNINRDYDISYGLYLYAWPIAELTILYIPSISPLQLSCVTFLFALLMGALSWCLVEKPVIDFLHRRAN
jgi:hypothetical protein